MSSKMIVKITLMGDGAVGKTSLRNRFMGLGFDVTHSATIGADFAAHKKLINYKGNEYDITFQIWDMAGQKRFQEVRSRFYYGAQGGLVLFDVTRQDSFYNLNSWIEELWKYNGNKQPIVPIVIIGNKIDLRETSTSVPRENGIAYAAALSQRTEPYGFTVKYIETSAKSGENVELAFEELAKVIIDFHTARRNAAV